MMTAEYFWLIQLSVNTEDQPHTSSNLLKITKMSKELAEQTFSCKVASFVTDTAANMKKMREELQNESEGSSFDIISYGCSCHALNLLAHDFVNADRDKSKVLSEVVNIIKFFRNHNLPNFWYKDAGGKELIMPIDVRWNSHCGSLQSYIDNWQYLQSYARNTDYTTALMLKYVFNYIHNTIVYIN